MSTYEYIQIGMVLFIFIGGWIAVKFITHLRTKRHNRELWGTIFEGVTHKLINLDAIKEPEVFIEKKARRSSQGNAEYKREDEDKTLASK